MFVGVEVYMLLFFLFRYWKDIMEVYDGNRGLAMRIKISGAV